MSGLEDLEARKKNLCLDFARKCVKNKKLGYMFSNKNDCGRIISGNKSPAKLSSAFPFPHRAHPPQWPPRGNSIPISTNQRPRNLLHDRQAGRDNTAYIARKPSLKIMFGNPGTNTKICWAWGYLLIPRFWSGSTKNSVFFCQAQLRLQL